MGQDNTAGQHEAIPSTAELELRRYEARLGFWKVFWGTFIVGLAGIAIPGIISLFTVYSENERNETELRLSQEAAHQQYIKDFFGTAINQDIELRIRFAEYFANLSGPGQEKLWNNYLGSLKKLRVDNRKKINDLEKRLVDFKKMAPNEIDNAEFDRINRELAWALAEIGYVPTERSAVIASPGGGPIGKKTRLYKETTNLVRRLASGSEPLLEHSGDLARFWILYRKDLIGVESSEFARTMIEIGKVLNSLSAADSAPNTELKSLSEELSSISRQELAEISQAAVQQQQQQQQQQQIQTPLGLQLE